MRSSYLLKDDCLRSHLLIISHTLFFWLTFFEKILHLTARQKNHSTTGTTCKKAERQRAERAFLQKNRASDIQLALTWHWRSILIQYNMRCICLWRKVSQWNFSHIIFYNKAISLYNRQLKLLNIMLHRSFFCKLAFYGKIVFFIQGFHPCPNCNIS